jgi:hypothetical protein
VYTVLITIAVFVLLRLLYEWQLRPRRFASLVGTAVRDELSALLIVLGTLFGLFVLTFILSLVFGPIPPVHEW